MKSITEKSREIPVVAEVEVLVAGGGPAGIGAALGAARTGAPTMIIEQLNTLGGMATTGMMSHWCGGTESPLLDEITHRMLRKQALSRTQNQVDLYSISHECLKNVFFDMMEEDNVQVQLYTQIVDVIKEDNKVVGVVTESKSGREAILAKVVIDATGDGDAAARAGAEYILGRETDHVCQPVTLMFRIGGVDYNQAIFPGSFETKVDVPKGEIQALARQHLPHPAGHVLLYPARFPGEVTVNMTNVINIDATNVRDLTKAEIICHRQIEKIIDFLREFAPGYKNCYLVSTAQNVGVRETRHFKGLYCLHENDIVEAKVFDDWIATRNFFNFDIHSLKGPGLDEHGAQHHFVAKGKYSIPYRSCVPEKIDGLLLSGRNICGTHKAHSNYRVMPICLNIGQGVGVAAAVAARQNIQARQVDVKAVQQILNSFGVKV